MARSNAFALDVSKFVKKAKGNTEIVVKKITLDVFKSVIMATPVDTGRARANWIFSFNTPSMETTENTDKGPVTQNGAGKSSTYNGIVSQVASTSMVGTNSFITNSLPYIEPLEYGYSSQALGGMVRMTIARFTGISQNAVKLVKR